MNDDSPTMRDGPRDDAIISARDVVVRFGQVVALDRFTVDIPEGMIGLLGPNGAGKSTFIKAVLGLVEPQGGKVTVAGLDSREGMMEVRDRIGYMPEHDCLVDTMTAVELVSYLGRISGMSKGDSIPRGHEVLDFVGIGEERYRPIGSYSTGMKQRVKLAQAIVHDPGILFLDEPTNGMDPRGREEMLELISRIAASGRSILVSSHILHDVERVCKHVVIVNGGSVVTEGSMDSLLSKGEGRRKLKVRGSTEALQGFIGAMSERYEVVSISEEYGQVTMAIIDREGSGPIFRLAGSHGVQVRSYLPDRISLEDVFIDTVREVR